jgi:hypothetical protein
VRSAATSLRPTFPVAPMSKTFMFAVVVAVVVIGRWSICGVYDLRMIRQFANGCMR